MRERRGAVTDTLEQIRLSGRDAPAGARGLIAKPGSIGVERWDETVVLRPEDRLDLIGYAQLEECLYEQAELGASRIVLDLSEVTLLSSTCMAALMRFWAELRGRGGSLVIARPTHLAMAYIRACNLDDLIAVCSTREQALATVQVEQTGRTEEA